MKTRFQRFFKWPDIRAAISKSRCTTRRVYIRSSFFLININDLSNDRVSTAKLFVDDTSSFSIVQDAKTSAQKLNKNLQKFLNGYISGKCCLIRVWTSRLKKLAIFSRKITKSSHPLIYLNSTMHLFLVLVFILHDQSNNESLCQKIESIQYNAALAITGAIRGTSQAKLAIQWIRFSISQV